MTEIVYVWRREVIEGQQEVMSLDAVALVKMEEQEVPIYPLSMRWGVD